MYDKRGRSTEERRVDGMTRDEACRRYQRRIVLLARRLAERLPPEAGIGVEDLAGFGAIGLLEAFDRYDASRNILFSTFAEYRIRGAMMDALRQNDAFTRYRRDLSRRIEHASRTLTLQYGREPEPEEVAAALDMDLESYWQARDSIVPVSHVNLDAPAEGDGEEGRSLADTLAGDDGEGPYRAILAEQVRERLREAIGALPERKRQCVILYYGRGMNLAEIAQVFGVTPSRISQILSAARKELRRALEGVVEAGDLDRQDELREAS